MAYIGRKILVAKLLASQQLKSNNSKYQKKQSE